eukprot:CAMPEP_0181224464 /NCGR_PEP_ID=MMETSP1096-20121128/31142_1 /TAXON_ID=156174 ORGANISM="Chrysochromulina ericina, Strain CCMP281" /NCGR_SAMPLE_ID=MMETSP1096 /ASSEMBLY_ACC=CAM_ASM_000453 /LENGTH=48 /DNA_ID= /DNA_START= /DNA_END= /DNA_ORIENTATION=
MAMVVVIKSVLAIDSVVASEADAGEGGLLAEEEAGEVVQKVHMAAPGD